MLYKLIYSTMPVIRSIKLNLDTDLVLRSQGAHKNRAPLTAITTTIDTLLVSVEKEHLLETAVIYDFYPVLSLDHKGVSFASRHYIASGVLQKLYPQAKEFALAVCTIGSALENRAARLFSKKEALRATLLDAIGSAAIDTLAQEACKIISQDSSARNYQAGGQIRPGMPGLHISQQSKILEMVGAHNIGVTTRNGELMIPQKSVSLMVGIGTNMNIRSRSEVCSNCNLKDSCPYKISAEDTYERGEQQ